MKSTNQSVPLSSPDIIQADIDAVSAVLRSGQLSLGPALSQFETAFAEYTGCEHAVAVSSGTAALHLALLALGVGTGDEVITTPFSFVASANCALMVGAAPVFVDIDPQTWNMDPNNISAAVTDRTRAILPVHVFGQPCPMETINQLARDHGLYVIEDACEALGAKCGQGMTGTLGDVAVFGFYPNKQMTTAEGGMLVTRHPSVSTMARSLRNQGRDDMSPAWLIHQRLGYNYRLSDVHCALGLSQLSRIDEILQKRNTVAHWYRQRLAGSDRLVLQQIAEDMHVSWFVMVVRLADNYSQQDRDRILQTLRSQGIGCNNYFVPIHLQSHFQETFGFSQGDFPNCEHVAERTVALPFHANLDEQTVDHVCKALLKLL